MGLNFLQTNGGDARTKPDPARPTNSLNSSPGRKSAAQPLLGCRNVVRLRLFFHHLPDGVEAVRLYRCPTSHRKRYKNARLVARPFALESAEIYSPPQPKVTQVQLQCSPDCQAYIILTAFLHCSVDRREALVNAGRKEKRNPRKFEVWLSGGGQSAFAASTENISSDGLRVRTERPRKADTYVFVKSSKGELCGRARIVYCQTLQAKTYALGLEFLTVTDEWAARV